jgi:outer membrane immunogenic protein
MKKALISSVVFGMLIAGGAMAAELPVKAPPAPPPVFNWNGWYIGINGGGAWGKTDTTLDVQNTRGAVFTPTQIAVLDALGTNSFNNNGWLIGGQVGYTFETAANFVFGLEFAADFTEFRGGSFSNTGFLGVPTHVVTVNDGFSNNTGGLFTFLGRVGYDFGGAGGYYRGGGGFGFIPYWTIGAAATKVTHNFNFVDNTLLAGCACAVTVGSQLMGGAAVGGGIEWRFIDHWSLRGEWLYIDFGTTHGTLLAVNPAGTAVAAFDRGVSFKESIARGFLSYKF